MPDKFRRLIWPHGLSKGFFFFVVLNKKASFFPVTLFTSSEVIETSARDGNRHLQVSKCVCVWISSVLWSDVELVRHESSCS